jgi:hypothetical protein
MTATLEPHAIDTAAVTLDVPLHPITVLPLTDTGMMPDVDGPPAPCRPRPHVPRHLPPRNRTEAQLLSVWVNTHQAMFITVGMAAYAVRRGVRAITSRDAAEADGWLGFARYARLASAAYTDLPALTRPLYEAYVRQSMRQVHPGFSGVSNLEAITMELALRELKAAVQECQAADRRFAAELAAAVDGVTEADHFWWQAHGRAMRRMVHSTVSLARMDAKRQAGDGAVDFADYRDKILRAPKSLTDYDGYFAVERRPDLTRAGWRAALEQVLATADDFVASDGPVAARWRPVRPHLFEMIDRAGN